MWSSLLLKNDTVEVLANTEAGGLREGLASVCSSSSAEEPDVRTRKIVKVVTQTMVDGKVVDESSEVEQIEETKK